MQSREKDKLVFIRLFPDEDLHEKLKEACKVHKVNSAVVFSGLGQLKNIRLGYFKEKNDYVPEFFNKPHELLSLTGNICKKNNEYILHLHAVLGDESKNTFGGHLLEGKVEVTNEIVLLKTDMKLKRKFEEKTGLQGLFFE
jgi:predicted DNA-binding protein with PD1-like motif